MGEPACNLDAGGVRKRRTAGIFMLAAGVLGSVGAILGGQHLLVRIGIALFTFGFASLSLLQARAKT